MPIIYTIGYVTHNYESFFKVLKKYNINAIADVRTRPYSRFKPEFNSPLLKKEASLHNIHYVNLGEQLGAAPEDESCYIDGQIDFTLLRNKEYFKEGLERLKVGSQKIKIVLMCAEKNPGLCHRGILISRSLKELGFEIRHIAHDDLEGEKLITHQDLEGRLVRQYQLNTTLFDSPEEQLYYAYHKVEKKIAHRNERKEKLKK